MRQVGLLPKAQKLGVKLAEVAAQAFRLKWLKRLGPATLYCSTTSFAPWFHMVTIAGKAS